MRTYARGDRTSHADRLSKTAKLKYWLVDSDRNPIGKPFLRRSEIEQLEASIGGDYQIITGRRGRPSSGKTKQEIKRAHDRKRAKDPKRMRDRAEQERNYRKRKKEARS